jgi:hypothetical protein
MTNDQNFKQKNAVFLQRVRDIYWNLRFVICYLFGIWCLGFGISYMIWCLRSVIYPLVNKLGVN